MTPQEFLRAVLADDGFCVLAVLKKDGGFRHKLFDDHAHLIAASNLLSDAGEQVFFGLGTLKERSVTKTDSKGVERTHVRVGENIKSLKSLWIDIDIDPNPERKSKRCYPTQQEAFVALRHLCKTIGLPKPIVVQSGGSSGGLHVYFPFTEAIASEEWVPLAAKFKAVLAHIGFKADPARTSDRSSVLRLPGVMNIKRNERVRAVLDGVETDPAVLDRLLEDYVQEHTLLVQVPNPAPQSFSELGENLIPPKPVSFERLVRVCKQMGAAARDKGNVDEPLWYARLQLLRFCEKGEKAAHFLSKGHPRYSPAETDRKLTQLTTKMIGPTLCMTLDSLNPNVCDGCAHRGTIKSPITLAYEEPIEDTPIQTTVHTLDGELETVTIPNPPYPYARRKGGGVLLRHKDADGNDLPETLLYENDIYPIKRYVHTGHGHREETLWRVHLPKDGTIEFVLNGKQLADQQACAVALMEHGVIVHGPMRAKFMTYLTKYYEELQKAAEAEKIFNRLGWRDEGFVLNDKLYTKRGPVPSHNKMLKPLLPGIETKGSHEEWCEAVKFLETPGMEAFGFAFLASYGAPLLRATELTGAVINLVGGSGSGKTSSLRVGCSVWGNWQELLLNGDKSGSTINARLHRFSIHNNLPVCFDEITNLPAEDASSLVYSATVGRDKIKMDRTGERERDSVGTWQTILVSTSNLSLYDKFSSFKRDASAEMARVIECPAPHASRGDADIKRNADRMLSVVTRNYGHSGPIFIDYVARNQDKVFEQVRALVDKLDQMRGFSAMDRFWIGAVAATVVGGHTAIKSGALTWSPESVNRVAKWAVKLLQSLSQQVSSSNESGTPQAILSDFIAEHANKILVVHTLNDTITVSKEPHGDIIGTLDRTAMILWIRRDTLRRWLVRNGINTRMVTKGLEDDGVLINSHTRKNLTAGTMLPPSRPHCYVFRFGPDVGVEADLEAVYK